MPNKCCVPLCTSGYKTDLEKVRLFPAPTDPLMRKRWTWAIPRKNYVVTESSYVCAKHFTTDDISQVEIKKGKQPRKKPQLKTDAVPTIFPAGNLILIYLSDMLSLTHFPIIIGCPKRLTVEKKMTCRSSVPISPIPLYNEWDLPTTNRTKKTKPEKPSGLPADSNGIFNIRLNA